MSLQDLYCLAYAPLQGTGLDSVNDSDFNLENVLKELSYLKNFSSCALSNFINYLESKECTAELKTSNCSAALYCLSSFFSRLQNLCIAASNISSGTLGNEYPDASIALKDLMTAAQATGLTPTDSNLEIYLDTEADAEWEIPQITRGKVGFRQSVSIIKPETEEGSVDTTFHTSHGSVKGGDFSRRKARQATGYAKFTFKDSEKGSEGETDEDYNVKSYPSSTATGSTKVSEKSAMTTEKKRTKKEEAKNISNVQKSKSPLLSVSCSANVSSDAKSSSSDLLQSFANKTKTDSKSSYSSARSCWGLCSGVDSEEDSAYIVEPLTRRESSVALGNVEEIQDQDADENWHDNSRHSERFTRIRNRKPTGHPNLLTGTSDELVDLIDHMDSEETKNAAILLENTQINCSAPPFFCDTPTGSSNSITCQKKNDFKFITEKCLDEYDILNSEYTNDMYNNNYYCNDVETPFQNTPQHFNLTKFSGFESRICKKMSDEFFDK